MITIGSLFAGIGGFELGLERAIPNSETIWQVEQNKFCQRVLQKHWPHAKIYDDVKNITKNNVKPVDILCGGFPCQDLSVAGKGAGIHAGKKSSLYFEMHRIISELRPRIVVMENVPAITFRGLDSVLGSLSQIGYDAEWTIISAAQFGAPHLRKRWFCVAYPNGNGIGEKNKIRAGRSPSTLCDSSPTFTNADGQRPGQACYGRPTSKNCKGETIFGRRSPRENFTIKKQIVTDSQGADLCKRNLSPVCMEENRTGHGRSIRDRSDIAIQQNNQGESPWQFFPAEPPLCSRNDGISDRLARLRALGNAIVPQCSEWIGQQIYKSGLLEGLNHELR